MDARVTVHTSVQLAVRWRWFARVFYTITPLGDALHLRSALLRYLVCPIQLH